MPLHDNSNPASQETPFFQISQPPCQSLSSSSSHSVDPTGSQSHSSTSTHLSGGLRTVRNPYCTRLLDSSIPLIPVAPLLNKNRRVGKKFWEKPVDLQVSTSYGDPVIQKPTTATRLFFQNIKGLSTSAGKEDYRYVLDCLQTLQVDVAGLAETNTCWQHPHLRDDFVSISRKLYRQSKAVFGSPSQAVDPIPMSEWFQAGGNVSFLHGGLVSRIDGSDIMDSSGLGRWSGFTLAGKHGQSFLFSRHTGYVKALLKLHRLEAPLHESINTSRLRLNPRSIQDGSF